MLYPIRETIVDTVGVQWNWRFGESVDIHTGIGHGCLVLHHIIIQMDDNVIRLAVGLTIVYGHGQGVIPCDGAGENRTGYRIVGHAGVIGRRVSLGIWIEDPIPDRGTMSVVLSGWFEGICNDESTGHWLRV